MEQYDCSSVNIRNVMDIEPENDLKRYAVPTSELECSEYCFRVEVNFGKPLKDDPGVTDLKKILTGLLNTSGGIVYICSQGNQQPDPTILDKWKNNLGDALSFIPSEVYRRCIEPFNSIHPIILCAKRSDKLITLATHMVVRKVANNEVLKYSEDVKVVMTRSSKRPAVDPFRNNKQPKYGSKVDINEDRSIELKHWGSVTSFNDTTHRQTYKSSFQHDRTEKTLFALANMPRGGYLIIGVEDTTKIVRGQILSETDEKNLEYFIESFLEKDAEGRQRIWGYPGHVPKRNVDWQIAFLPVTGVSGIERRRLIVISFRHFPGGVWMREPESFVVSEEGYVCRLPFEGWMKGMMNDDDKAHTTERESEEAEELQSSLVDEKPLGRQMDDVLGRPDDKNGVSKGDDMDLQTEASDSSKHQITDESNRGMPSPQSSRKLETDRVSWTKSRGNWHANLHLYPAECNIRKIARQSSLLDTDIGDVVNFTPEIETIIKSQPGYEDAMKNFVEHVKNCSLKSFGIAALRWSLHVQTSLIRPHQSGIDLFCVDETGQIDIWTCTIEVSNERDTLWDYLFQLGRITKRRLLLDCSSFRLHLSTLHVRCHVYNLSKNEEQQWRRCTKPECLEYMTMEDGHLDELKITLAGMLLKLESRIKHIFGEDRSIILTKEQISAILRLQLSKFNFIEGPPGSGKTYIPLFLCQKYPNYAYICTTQAFKNFLVFQGLDAERIFITNKVVKFSTREMYDLEIYIQCGHFDNVQYIIFDDFQNMPFSESVWQKLFDCVAANCAAKLIVLGDSQYQHFTDEMNSSDVCTYMHSYCKQHNYHMTEHPLKVMHRNTQKVTSFILSSFDASKDKDVTLLSCSRHELGDDVEIRALPMNTSSINSFLLELVKELEDARKVVDSQTTHYEAKDIAILVDMGDEGAAEDIRKFFRKEFGLAVEVHDAGTFPVTGYTIDTLKNFMGLDRKVCIVVTSKVVQNTRDTTGRSFANPRYKTFLASRGTTKVVFVINELDTESASKFGLSHINISSDKQGLRRLCCVDGVNWIVDLCFIRFEHHPVVLYITNDPTDNLRSMNPDGSENNIKIDANDIRSYRCIASNLEGSRVALSGWSHPCNKCVFYKTTSGRLEKEETIESKERVESICWAKDELLMICKGRDVHKLVRVSADRRSLHSFYCESCVKTSPQIACASRRGTVFLCNQRNIKELDLSGQQLRLIDIPGVDVPLALCVNSTGDFLFVSGYHQGSVHFIKTSMKTSMNSDSSVISNSAHVKSMRLHEDKYLGVITMDGLVLYDISGLEV